MVLVRHTGTVVVSYYINLYLKLGTGKIFFFCYFFFFQLRISMSASIFPCELSSRSSLSLVDGSTAGLTEEAKSSLGQFATFLSLLQLLLGLAVLGEVEGGDLLGLLDLLLVGLDLELKLGGKLGHAVLVLLVLVLLEGKLLHLPLSLLVALEAIPGAGLDVAQLDLHLADARLQLGHGVAASADGG